jgi:hypothetical protein
LPVHHGLATMAGLGLTGVVLFGYSDRRELAAMKGKKERGATRFTPMASATGEVAELCWQQWTMVAAVLTSTAKRRGNGEVEPELGVDAG